MFQVLVEHAFNFLSLEYVDLFNRARATAFQHPLWLQHLYAMLLNPGTDEPLVVTVRTKADGRLLLVLPLVRRRLGLMRVVEFADLGVSDYAEPVCDEETLSRILADDEACARIQDALAPYTKLSLQPFNATANLRRHFKRLEQWQGVLPRQMSKHG